MVVEYWWNSWFCFFLRNGKGMTTALGDDKEMREVFDKITSSWRGPKEKVIK